MSLARAQCPGDMLDPAHLEHYGRVLANLAVPYRVDKRGHATRTELPSEGINAQTGLVSTARDLANFDLALDDGDPASRGVAAGGLVAGGRRQPARLRRPASAGSSRVTAARTVVWQFGLVDNAYSAMIVKVPVPPRDDDPAREQRRARHSVPARGRRRHAVAVRVGAAPNAAVSPSASRRCLRAARLCACIVLLLPARHAPSGSSRRSSATPSTARPR